MKKGTKVVLTVMAIILAIVSGIGIAHVNHYVCGSGSETIRVRAKAQVYPYTCLPSLTSQVIVDAAGDDDDHLSESNSFATMIAEFSEVPLEELIDSDSFPIKVEVIGSVKGPNGTLYIVEGKSGNYYVICP